MDLDSELEDSESNGSTSVKEATVVEDGDIERKTDSTEENSLIEPASSPEAVKQLYDQFEELKSEIIDHKNDTQKIGGNRFIKKSGWRKIATAFNLSVETVSEHRTVDDGVLIYTVKAVARAPNGKTALGTGKCASNESNFMAFLGEDMSEAQKEFEKYKHRYDEDDIFLVEGSYRLLLDPRQVDNHDISATAETRAKNRAISDCVGGGEVSAEEVSKDDVL